MPHELTITAPDHQRLGVIQSLPAWLTSRLALGSIESRKSVSGYPTQVLVLPGSALLTQPERIAVSAHLDELRPLLTNTPENHRESARQSLALITKMMLALPSRKTGEAGAEATGEAYTIAVDDIPSFALSAALRRWYRKECGPQYDCAWRPAPGDLRELSLTCAGVLRWRIIQLERLLAAEAQAEFSESHCAAMRQKLALAFAKPALKPVPRAAGGIGDGRHAQRVMAELEAKRRAREPRQPA